MSKPISEETLTQIEAVALKARRTSFDHVPVDLVNLACDNVPQLIVEVRRLNLQIQDLHAALSLLKAELKERGERIEASDRQISGLQKALASVTVGFCRFCNCGGDAKLQNHLKNCEISALLGIGEKGECLHGGVFRGEKCHKCGQDVR